MNPLLIESLARQQIARHPSAPAGVSAPAPRPRRPSIRRFGEMLVAVGTRLATTGFDPSVVGVGVGESW